MGKKKKEVLTKIQSNQRNAWLDEAQAGIKIAGEIGVTQICRPYGTLMAESEEELKSLLMKMKEEGEKVGLKMQHSEN